MLSVVTRIPVSVDKKMVFKNSVIKKITCPSDESLFRTLLFNSTTQTTERGSLATYYSDSI